MALKQPVAQVRLTNVAIVRYKHSGYKFEVACYKNKIIDYRSGKEKDINEVLQTINVFSNVSKGIIANKNDIKKCFNNIVIDSNDIEVVCKYILDHGDIQLSEKERQIEYENKYREIATLISDKTINTDTHRPFSVSIIENTMHDIHINISINKSAKSQALDIIKKLKQVLPNIQRAQMRIHISLPINIANHINDKQLKHLYSVIENESYDYEYNADVIIDPGQFRIIEDIISKETKGRGRIDIIDHKVNIDDDNDFDTNNTVDDNVQSQQQHQYTHNSHAHTQHIGHNKQTQQQTEPTNKQPLTDNFKPNATLDDMLNNDDDNHQNKPSKTQLRKQKKQAKKQNKQLKQQDSDSDNADLLADLAIKPSSSKVKRKQLKQLAKRQQLQHNDSDSDDDEITILPPASKKAQNKIKQQQQTVPHTSDDSSSESDTTESSDATNDDSSNTDSDNERTTKQNNKKKSTQTKTQVKKNVDDDSD